VTHIMCRRIRQARIGNGKTEITFKRKTKGVQVSSNYIPPYFSYASFTCVEELTQGSLTRDATKGDKREFQN
jgi:hypothetical protein